MAYNSTPKLPKKAPRLQDSLVTKIQEIRELKDTIKDLHAQAEKDKQFLRQVQDESNNLELALQKCIESKAQLNDKFEQLQDAFDRYMGRYHSTRVVAECLAEAIHYMIKANKNGE